ncbi:ABC transporter permease [Bifidobacterium aquikefiricola]|uniref:ABC transporter permease n=1 Tax=Bifidobacterium aquikefiricola TaxID=3059038 RepID=A0AB39U8F4_9BIFI
MQTFKTALRIIWAHKLYMLLYVLTFGALMLALGISSIIAAGNDANASSTGSSGTTAPSAQNAASKLPKANIAIINRDSGNLAQGLHEYLGSGATMVTLQDTPQRLQDAIARNDVDLIVIIPKGFSERFDKAAISSHNGQSNNLSASNGSSQSSPSAMPLADTTVSYLSSEGVLAKTDVNGFFSELRSVLASGVQPDLSSAVRYVVRQSKVSSLSPTVKVVKEAADTGKSMANSFGLTIKLSIYPVFMAMTTCISLLIGVFNAPETRRRLNASSVRSYELSAQQLLGGMSFGLLCWALYYSIALLAIMPFNHGFSAISVLAITKVGISQLVCTLTSMAFGFMIGQFRASPTVASAIAVSFGLILMFTSGAAFDPAVMPQAMVTLGKLLPGWWFTTSINDALGLATFQTPHPSMFGWLQSMGLVALFGCVFVCVGLAGGRYRSAHAEFGMANRVTELTEH